MATSTRHPYVLGEKSAPLQTARVLPAAFYDSFLSDIAKSRRPSPIRDLMARELDPGMLSLLAGKPNPETFPFTSITMIVQSPFLSTSDGTREETELVFEGEDLAVALQYTQNGGLQGLLDWFMELNNEVHGSLSGEGRNVTIGCGSLDLLDKTFMDLINPGDTVLVESPLYPGISPILTSLECSVIEVPSDGEGIKPCALLDILKTLQPNRPRPKLLYTVPYGANPAGTMTPVGRRRDILRIAQQYNFIILEDDPYFYIYYGSQPRPPSYLSLEKDATGEIGRVLRFDSMSKTLAAGLRIGWMTAPQPIIDVITRHTGNSMINPPVMSQAIILKLVKKWGIAGYLAHATRVAGFYERRRDVFEAALKRHLTGLAEWTTPTSGMFYWVKFLHLDDSERVARGRALPKRLLFRPGSAASSGDRKSCFVRMSFSLLDDEGVDEALHRLVDILSDRS